MQKHALIWAKGYSYFNERFKMSPFDTNFVDKLEAVVASTKCLQYIEMEITESIQSRGQIGHGTYLDTGKNTV